MNSSGLHFNFSGFGNELIWVFYEVIWVWYKVMGVFDKNLFDYSMILSELDSILYEYLNGDYIWRDSAGSKGAGTILHDSKSKEATWNNNEECSRAITEQA